MNNYEEFFCIYKDSRNYWLIDEVYCFFRLLKQNDMTEIFATLNPYHITDIKDYISRCGFYPVQAKDIYENMEKLDRCVAFISNKQVFNKEKLKSLKTFENGEKLVVIMPII